MWRAFLGGKDSKTTPLLTNVALAVLRPRLTSQDPRRCHVACVVDHNTFESGAARTEVNKHHVQEVSKLSGNGRSAQYFAMGEAASPFLSHQTGNQEKAQTDGAQGGKFDAPQYLAVTTCST